MKFNVQNKTLISVSFEKDEKAVEIIIPDGVENIKEYAFNLCERAKEFVIPASVKKIGYMAFAGTGAKKITFLGVPEHMEIGSFVLNQELEEIIIPENEKYAFVNGCLMDKQTKTVFSATVNAQIPDGTKAIARGTFACLMMKRDILIPDSVENVETLAFGPLFGAKVLVKKGSPAIKALKKAEVDYTEID